jgi:nicotinamidase/pyrazinamidase
MNALILVDIQNDFCPGGALAVKEGDQVVAVANRISPRFDAVVATQDWHPADHGSFAASHPGKSPGDLIDLNGLKQILWPTHCVQETRGTDFVAGLTIDHVGQVFRKGTDPGIDSYSAFFDNGHRKSTGLADWLRGREISDVYVMGLATDYCVKFTALDALKLGFNTFLIEDGCRGVDLKPGDVDRAIEEMRKAGVTITRSDQLTIPMSHE